MSDKRTCPACDSWTSAVFRAFSEGEPCPYCGFPADAADLFQKAQGRGVAQAVIDRMVQAEKRAQAAEAEAEKLRSIVLRVRRAIDEPATEASA